MPLSEPQQQRLENWMRTKAIVQCPVCEDAQWQFAEASYVRALLEQGAALRRRDTRHQGVVGTRERLIVFSSLASSPVVYCRRFRSVSPGLRDTPLAAQTFNYKHEKAGNSP